MEIKQKKKRKGMKIKEFSNRKKAALIGGLSLLVNTLTAPFADLYVIETKILAHGDPTQTSLNVTENDFLFRASILILVLNIFADVTGCYARHVFFKSVNKNLSLLCAWFFLIYCSIFASSTTFLLTALRQPENAYDLITQFKDGWAIGFLFFGPHLMILGWFFLKEDTGGTVVKILGTLLIVAGLGYSIDSIALLFNVDVEVAVYTFYGELMLLIWFLYQAIFLKREKKE